MTDLSIIGDPAEHGEPAPISAEMPAGHACAILLTELLAEMVRAEQVIPDDNYGEALHDYRIAVRKARSLLPQLQGILSGPDLAVYREGFAAIMKRTGPVRDLEVCRAMLSRNFAANNGEIEALYRRIHKQEQAQRRALIRYLRSKRYRELVTGWAECLQRMEGENVTDEQASCPVRVLARDAILKRFEKAKLQGARLDGAAGSKQFHKMRKSTKKLRYLLDIFRDLYPDELHDRIRKNMKKLQGCLGGIQDIEVQSCVVTEALDWLGDEAGRREVKTVKKLLKKMKHEKKDLKQDSVEIVSRFAKKPGRKIEELLAQI